jgi:hypothetical protein
VTISTGPRSGLDPPPLIAGRVTNCTLSNAAGAKSGRGAIGNPSAQPRNMSVASSRSTAIKSPATLAAYRSRSSCINAALSSASASVSRSSAQISLITMQPRDQC